MSLSIYVQGIPDKNNERSWQIDCIQWPRPLLEKDVRFRVVDLNSAYMDYVAVLSVEEALELNQKYLDWHENNKKLQQILEETKKSTSLVVVRMYEWESGLD